MVFKPWHTSSRLTVSSLQVTAVPPSMFLISGWYQAGSTLVTLERILSVSGTSLSSTLNLHLDVEFAGHINFGLPQPRPCSHHISTPITTLPRRRYDFPLRTGDQWYMPFHVRNRRGSGSSDYFDPADFDTNGAENTSWQVTADGIPTEDGLNYHIRRMR